MPIAAVPNYLGTDFAAASPGLRFGMFLKLWGIDSRSYRNLWTTHDVNYHQAGRDRTEHLFKDDNKTSALKAAATLNRSDLESMAELAKRQQAVFQMGTGNDVFELVAISIAPFTTGLGNEHPLENGFAFLNPYGLPYLPGSGVKGVVRRAAEELAHRNFFANDSDWTLPAIWHLFGFEPWLVPKGKGRAEWDEWLSGFSVRAEEIEAYLNAVLKEDYKRHEELKQRILDASDPIQALLKEQHLHIRGVLDFWDVIPQISGNKLAVEIMTPHYSHYYQNQPNVGSDSPHDSGQPNPISFLTVPPSSKFTFHVVCDINRLKQLEPNLAKDDRWKKLLEAVFKHAFDWCGFGAKTAVGYGAMKTDPCVEEAARRKAEEKSAQEEERQQREAKEAKATRRQAEQAEFDALPESRKRIIQVDRALHAFQEGSWFDESRRNELKGQANRLSAEACAWPDAAAREEAAALLERLYDTIGWHDPGVKQDKRTKQEKKKRDAIACIREN